MKKILLHTCCGPCTTHVNEWLKENGFEVKGYFYNPNIRPQLEYEKRLLVMEFYATAVGLKVIYDRSQIITEPGDCINCYKTRLEKTAQMARELNFEYFSTTLLISPYQKHQLLKETGEGVGEKYRIKFYYQDFRAGYRQSRQMAREMKLYMQKYCGCGLEGALVGGQERRTLCLN
jgi:predicted adenine nucleotide alpha hydrolase (AANH) superfamily ATPase